jgi:hypothetical protein
VGQNYAIHTLIWILCLTMETFLQKVSVCSILKDWFYCFHHSIWQTVWTVIHFSSSLIFWYSHQLSGPGGQSPCCGGSHTACTFYPKDQCLNLHCSVNIKPHTQTFCWVLMSWPKWEWGIHMTSIKSHKQVKVTLIGNRTKSRSCEEGCPWTFWHVSNFCTDLRNLFMLY